jgi:hypothetical protein
MTKQRLNELVVEIAIRDMRMSSEAAEAWFESVGIIAALYKIARNWWVYEIAAPEAHLIREQLLSLENKGQLCFDKESGK